MCWKQCEYTKCKFFWNSKCLPPEDLEEHGGDTEFCFGFFFIRHLCCTEKKSQVPSWLAVEHNPKNSESPPNFARLQ